MIAIEKTKRKTIAFYISDTDGKGPYPAKRAAILSKTMAAETNIVFITGGTSPPPPDGFRTVAISKKTSLADAVSFIAPDLLIRDTGSTSAEEAELISKRCPAVMHFDDFGEGAHFADIVLQTLEMENADHVSNHMITDRNLFIADEHLLSFAKSGLKKGPPQQVPHLVVHFGDKDEGNLAFRALRHLSQLHIPLSLTIVIGEQYPHDTATLRMMALSRRNTILCEPPFSLPELYASADVVLCGSGYMPHEAAVIGVPCVVLSQNDFEAGLAFPREQHGFTHLGIGRKVKQSNLLNAIMEPLLHESMRKKAIERQLSLRLGGGKETVIEAIRYYLEYPKRDTRALYAERYATMREK